MSLLGFDALGVLTLGELPSDGTIPFTQFDWSVKSIQKPKSAVSSISYNVALYSDASIPLMGQICL